MKKVSYIVCLLFLLAGANACQSEQQNAQGNISKLETQLENKDDLGKATQLIQQYLDYATKYPEDLTASPRYLYRAAALQYRLNTVDAAKNSLEIAIRRYYQDENTGNAVLLLGTIYRDKLKNKIASSILFQCAAENFPDLSGEPAIQPGNFPPPPQRLNLLSQTMYPDTTGRLNLRAANDFITGASIYALISPDGDQAPELLYKAAETARTAQAFGKAIELYDWLIEAYPDFSKAPQAMFLKGFTLDNDLGRLEEARQIYEAFLAQYPQDDFADDAQFLLQNLGKTDEEIISSFGDQQAEQ